MRTDPRTSLEIRDMLFTFRQRRNRVLEMLKTIPDLGLNIPQGAFYFFPNVTSYFGKSYNGQLIKDATDLSMYLLDHGHVAVVPGDAFGNPYCIRISYATSLEKLTEAMSRIRNALAQLQ
jgi:aspartate aminotransferase